MVRKMNVFTKITALVCTVALATGLLAGCGKGTQNGGGTTSPTPAANETKKPVEVKLILPYSDEVPADAPLLPELNKLANADFKIEWTPMISYNDKFNVLMASNQLPDALVVPDLKLSVYVNGARAGMFWDLTSYMDKYPNFKNFNPIVITNSSLEGKQYVLPRERILKRKLVAYRADWAKKAGLKAPDTIENLYAMAKAFGTGDFDGNGKNDTIGLLLGTVNNEIDCFDALVTAFGGPNKWGVKDGKVVPNFMTKEYMDTMKWLKRMFDEKLISSDFAITKTTQQVTDFVDKEKSGLWLNYGIPGTADPLLKQKQQADANVKRGDIFEYTYLKGPDGKPRIPAEDGMSGGFVFPKQTVKDEARLKDLLSVFDKLQSQEGQRLINNGIEGKHFTLFQDKFIKSIDANVNKKEVASYGQMGMSGNLAYMAADDDIGMRLQKDRNTFATTDLIPNVSTPLMSDSYTSNKANLDKIINEAQFKFIMGQMSEDQFNQAIEQWKKSGGDKAIEEYTAAYAKAKK